jgi:hypothetical protein
MGRGISNTVPLNRISRGTENALYNGTQMCISYVYRKKCEATPRKHGRAIRTKCLEYNKRLNPFCIQRSYVYF